MLARNKYHFFNFSGFLTLFLIVLTFSSCGPSSRIKTSWKRYIKKDSVLQNAHTGIALMDAQSGKYLFKKQSDKYFTPASNTKIITLYTAMKHLGDSIAAFKYAVTNDTLYIQPLGDPSFLHPDFSSQPAFDFINKINKPVAVLNTGWETNAWGPGWAWSDYDAYYMAERSLFPVYGNCIRWTQTALIDKNTFPKKDFIRSVPQHPFPTEIKTDSLKRLNVSRSLGANRFIISPGTDTLVSVDVPFITNGTETALQLLGPNYQKTNTKVSLNQIFYSIPVDSVLRKMMLVSDNFLAEQLLLMTSMKRFGVMNEEILIDTLLKNELKFLPQPPGWSDGSGLSRYNLFTPEDFVILLNQMRIEFGMERLKLLFATGNEGTLKRYYIEEEGAIFAKTGTLSGVVCLSGYLYTKKNKLLTFSVLVNQHRQSAAAVRRAVEKFLKSVRNKN
jgi:D-alanyl-D-alanine carboxypeptidase/D-alanyl-D-alanine-endopeptidase (penicillin-binding protein 4)